jgi:hypothetical protein
MMPFHILLTIGDYGSQAGSKDQVKHRVKKDPPVKAKNDAKDSTLVPNIIRETISITIVLIRPANNPYFRLRRVFCICFLHFQIVYLRIPILTHGIPLAYS